MDKPWTDTYFVVAFVDGEKVVKRFHNNPAVAEYIEELVETYGVDPAIHVVVIKTENGDVLTVATRVTTQVVVGGY